MSQVLDDLVNLLTLEPIEENLFSGSTVTVVLLLFGGAGIIGSLCFSWFPKTRWP